MSQTPEPTPARPALPVDLPWGIHYLREDIQDLRQEIRGVRAEVTAQVNGLRGELKDLRRELAEPGQAVRLSLHLDHLHRHRHDGAPHRGHQL